ncbi:MAG: hypothetical protein HOQ38_13195 [Nonomuraea sp.]|nr:hypothetical protein [Nonomuraea sp.]
MIGARGIQAVAARSAATPLTVMTPDSAKGPMTTREVAAKKSGGPS